MVSILSVADSPTTRKFLRFLATGLLNTGFGYAVFALCVLAGAGPTVAAFVSTIAGVAFNFFTTRRFVFGYQGYRALPGFVGVYAVIYLVNVAGLKILIDSGVRMLLAQLLLLPLLVITSFLAMNRFVFPKRAR